MADVIGTLIPTKIPSLTDTANIQDAFRLYHYGDASYNTSNSDTANLVADSIAGQLFSKAPKASPTFTGTVTTPTLISTTASLTNLSVTTITSDVNFSSGKVLKINGTTVLSSTAVLGKTPGGTTSGDIVTIDDAQTLTNKTISGTQLVNSSVANGKLTNSSVTLGSTTVNLGDTVTSLSGLTVENATNASKAANYSGGFTKITVAATQPSNPSVGDVWIQIA
jgi:hypothetical protein